MNITYISWAPHCSRSDHTARELGGTSHMVYWGRLGSHPLTVWLKYLGQTVQTWLILLRARPEAIFVMTPPVFAVAAVWLYSAITKRPFVVDAHTASFLHPRWKYFQTLQFWFCRRAATTIVTNEHLRDLLATHDAHATIVPDVPVRFEPGESYPLDRSFNVAVICSFNPDEPISEILEAAALTPDVHFYVTGKPTTAHATFRVPPNVTLTGFLSVAVYGSLLQNADAVMSLTTRDHTMVRGGWEAIYQGTPVIVSDWPILRQAFDEGAAHVDNTAMGIADGISKLRNNHEAYRLGASRLRARKQERWETNRSLLSARLQAV